MGDNTKEENFKKLNEDLSYAGQPTSEQLQEAASAGFKAVLNLRSSTEPGSSADESAQAAAAGLDYANVPLSNENPDSEQISKALWEVESLPKPLLIHCGAGLRAGAIALIANAIEEELTLEQLTAKAQGLGIKLEQPHLKQFITERYPLPPET
ncbi:phosphatase [Phormidium tenue FACHB-886]|nr:phosphatase [Phormidium tenue FACHB-886]